MKKILTRGEVKISFDFYDDGSLDCNTFRRGLVGVLDEPKIQIAMDEIRCELHSFLEKQNKRWK